MCTGFTKDGICMNTTYICMYMYTYMTTILRLKAFFQFLSGFLIYIYIYIYLSFCFSLFSTAECSVLMQSNIYLSLDKEWHKFILILIVSCSYNLQLRIKKIISDWRSQEHETFIVYPNIYIYLSLLYLFLYSLSLYI